VVAQDANRVGELGQDEHGIGLPPHILAGLGLEIAIQALDTACKITSVVLLAQRHDTKIFGWSRRHSRHDPALTLCERPLKPFARRRRIDQSVEEHGSIPVGKNERLMLGDCPSGGVRQRGHAEIGQFAPFELRRSFDQSLGGFIDAKPKPFFPKPSVGFCCHGHGHLQPDMYVNPTNF
jgi:hypothetical protein